MKGGTRVPRVVFGVPPNTREPERVFSAIAPANVFPEVVNY